MTVGRYQRSITRATLTNYCPGNRLSLAMDLNDLQTTWHTQGRVDPLWAILSDPAKKGRRWDAEEFFATGVREVERLMSYLRGLPGAALGRRAALDFGCGVGRLTQPLAEHFTEVVGVDL